MRILAVDYGDARTGLAVCDRGELLASPVGVFHSADRQAVIGEICRQAETLQAGLVVVGNPLNMNGTAGPRSEKCAAFARELSELCGIPAEMYDERLTTVSAHKILSDNNVRGKKRKAAVDSLSARLILEDYMTSRKMKSI